MAVGEFARGTSKQHDSVIMPASSTEMDSDNANSKKSVKQPMWLYAKQTNNETITQASRPISKQLLPLRRGSNTTAGKKSSRGGVRIDHTIEQKLEIIQEYKGLNKSGMKEEYAKSIGVSTRTITRWINKEKELLKAKEQGRGRKKTIYNKDGLLRIKLGLMQFYEENERKGVDKIHITGEYKAFDLLKSYNHLNVTYSYIIHS